MHLVHGYYYMPAKPGIAVDLLGNSYESENLPPFIPRHFFATIIQGGGVMWDDFGKAKLSHVEIGETVVSFRKHPIDHEGIYGPEHHYQFKLNGWGLWVGTYAIAGVKPHRGATWCLFSEVSDDLVKDFSRGYLKPRPPASESAA